MGYFISAVCFVGLYIFAIPVMGRVKRHLLVDILASLSIYLMYLILVLRFYIVDGIHDWNFQNTLPVANVSPFMFSMIPLLWLLPKGAKKYFCLLTSLLSVGMLLAALSTCVYNGVIGYKFHWYFITDCLAHVILSLWGVYFVKSGRVKLNGRDCLISGSLIVGVAVIMMLLNVIFDTAFFGLSLNGKHNIYNNVITSSSALSALIYFAGLTVVLLLGYGFNKILTRKKK